MTEFVSVHVADDRPGVATVLLHRPPRNTLTRQVYRELAEVAAEVSRREDIDAVVLFGGHEVFCAGDDLDELRTLSVDEAAAGAALRERALAAVAAIAQPTVAAVTGYALGAGLGVALAADWRVCGDNVRVGSTEILAGLVPTGGTSRRLTAAVGAAAAKDLVLSGRFLDGPEALRLGLIDEMVAPDGVFDAAAERAARFVGLPRRSVAAAKAAITAAVDAAPSDALDAERRGYIAAFGEACGRFGTAADGR
ncbi:enoyl-CoA hydratase [Mycobacterium sp. MYCO198283]|uniref:enoyl-CoA hydratase n=1 Tax=Mycobacterium sp. MYCO198283 TaxID=2883505 RepID=UPI001E3473CC|nr:enoyl-CoA hydratase [Mycobacterium sp. MYCO198283]MCG5434358.1 enoyl-CoA hydratase [Mycobacterium sp. MYCO198283]